jgi:hypothetical protein
MAALAVGNGESRSEINLDQFSNHIIVGCNAIVRDRCVDHLICVDRRMVREALVHVNCPAHIYTRQDWIKEFQNNHKVSVVPELPYRGSTRADESFHWGSGPYAVLKAALLSDCVELLGFDLYSKDSRINNLYKGTPNYNVIDHHAIDPRYWIHQIAMVFTQFPDKYFVVYKDETWIIPEAWKLNNVVFKSLDTLTVIPI